MRANIVFKEAQIALNQVRVTIIGSTHVTFRLNPEMENAVVYQLLMNADAGISELIGGESSVIVKREKIDIEF